MKRLGILVILLFNTMSCVFSEDIVTLGGIRIGVSIPSDYLPVAKEDNFVGFRKKNSTGETSISIKFISYKEILTQTPMERSLQLYKLISNKSGVTRGDVIKLMDDYPAPVLFPLGEYFVYSMVQRIFAADGSIGEQYFALSRSSIDYISGPFVFENYFPVDEGIIRISVVMTNRDKQKFENAMKRYGIIIQGTLKFIGNNQVDSIFRDIVDGGFSEFPEVFEAYNVYKEILLKLDI